MANDMAATLLNSRVSDFLKIMMREVDKFKRTDAIDLLKFVEKVTGNKPTGRNPPTYDEQTWQKVVDALNAKLQEWRPEIKDDKRMKKVFKYDKTLHRISRMKFYEKLDLIGEFPPPSANNLAEPEPPRTEALGKAPSAPTPPAAPTPAPTPAPWARSGASSTSLTTTPQLATPTGDADALASRDEIASGDEIAGLPDAPPTASAAAMWLAPAARPPPPPVPVEALPPPPPPGPARQPATATPAAPANAEEPASTAEKTLQKIQRLANERQRNEIQQLKHELARERLEFALENQRLKCENQRLEVQKDRLKRKLRGLAQSVSQALDDAGDSDAEQEDVDADGSASEPAQDMDSDGGTSEPEQPVVPTSSVRDQVLPAGGSETEGATMVWPEGLNVKDLLQSGDEAEKARLAPLIKKMQFRQDVGHRELMDYFHNDGVKVDFPWLGRLRDGVTPFATVAFRTFQDALLFEEIVTDMARLRDSHVGHLISNLFDEGTGRWVGDPADSSASHRRLLFKNGLLSTFEASDLERRLAKYGPGVSVHIISYWDGRQQQQAPTDVIFRGFVKFAEESHANALWAALESVRDGQGTDIMVLKQIPGIATPIAFKRYSGYENRGS